MKTTTAIALALLLAPFCACDADDSALLDGADGVHERSQPKLKKYKQTRIAHTIEGVGGDLQWLQFIANGVSDDPASMHFIDVGAPAQCDGVACTLSEPSACLEEIFGRDLAEQQGALDEFVADTQERFGINLADPAHYLILPYTAREDVGIRAVGMSGVKTPSEGFPVHDCGREAVGIDGVSVPMVRGSYLIEAWTNQGHDLPVVLDFRLREPIIQAVGRDETPISVGRYDISSEIYGEGLAEFVVASECEGTIDPTYGVCLGTVHHNIRNSITFSDRGGL